MMDWTDAWCRLFHRGLTRHALLFTEMVVDQAVLHGDRARLLRRDEGTGPVALQLGGHDPARLAEAARHGEAAGFDEINLNCGCPSDRVQDGRIGACLMDDAAGVARAVGAMQAAVSVPVTVKCRIGIDDQDPHITLPTFLQALYEAGCGRVYVHARKAWLQGLSPRENREVPPLDYPLVRAMKQRFPDLEVCLNGGLSNFEDADREAESLDGVMFGRAAYQNPFALTQVDARYFAETAAPVTRAEAVAHLADLVDRACAEGQPAHRVTRHALGLFQAAPGARGWRRTLTEAAQHGGGDGDMVRAAYAAISERKALTAAE